MPNHLWPLFRDNPTLVKALSALATEVIKARMSAKYGLRVGVIAILHTFNGKLEFNSHVHTMVTGRGLHGSSDIWVSRVYYERDPLMEAWRRAVIALLRAALRAGQLHTKMTVAEMEEMLIQQEKCWWSINIQSFEDKWHFLQYAGRYVRRPPIAQRRITWIGERTVRFWFKDKKLRRRVEVQCSLEEFIDRWSQHIPEGYQHAVRSFGLFAPRALGQTSANREACDTRRASLRRSVCNRRLRLHQEIPTQRRIEELERFADAERRRAGRGNWSVRR